MNLERQDRTLRIRPSASSIRLQRLSRDKVHRTQSTMMASLPQFGLPKEPKEPSVELSCRLAQKHLPPVTCLGSRAYCVYITLIQVTKCLEIASRGQHISLQEGKNSRFQPSRQPPRPSQPPPDEKTRPKGSRHARTARSAGVRCAQGGTLRPR